MEEQMQIARQVIALREHTNRLTEGLSEPERVRLFTLVFSLKVDSTIGWLERTGLRTEDEMAEEMNRRIAPHSRGLIAALNTIPKFSQTEAIAYDVSEDSKDRLLLDEGGFRMVRPEDVTETTLEGRALEEFIGNSEDSSLDRVFDCPGFNYIMYRNMLLAFDPEL